MPSRRSPKPIVSKQKLPKPAPPAPRLDDVERLEITLAHTQAEVAHEKAERLKLERLVWLAKIDPTGRVLALEKEIASCGKSVEAAETRHVEWTSRVKARLGLQTDFSFDSETGVVTTEIPSGQ